MIIWDSCVCSIQTRKNYTEQHWETLGRLEKEKVEEGEREGVKKEGNYMATRKICSQGTDFAVLAQLLELGRISYRRCLHSLP